MADADERALELDEKLEPYREYLEKLTEGLPEWKAKARIAKVRAGLYKLARPIYKTPTGEKIVEVDGHSPGSNTRYMIMRNGVWRKVRVSQQ